MMPSASFCLFCLCIAENAQKCKCSEKSEKITEILIRQKTPGARRKSLGEAQSSHSGGSRGPRSLVPLGDLPATPFGLYICPGEKTLASREFF